MSLLFTILCFTIVAGRGITEDGSVLVGHNEDDYNVSEFYVNSSRQGLWAQVPGLKVADSFINRWGVSVVSDNCRSREDKEDLTDGGVLYELRYSVYQKARSARQAVEIIAALVESRGYSSSGRSYMVADSREAWVVSVVQGRHWVAQRVPDDQVMIIPNYYVIGKVDLADKDNFLAGPGLVEYAKERGWYDPDRDGEFSFRDAYAQRYSLVREHNLTRHAAVLGFFGFGYNPGGVPFSVKPDFKVNAGHLQAALSSVHHESTIYTVIYHITRRKPTMWFDSLKRGDYRKWDLDGKERRDTVKLENVINKSL